eukprot:GSChrysophyteH1.ASY1.ANO1.2349.1 assembled CDS
MSSILPTARPTGRKGISSFGEGKDGRFPSFMRRLTDFRQMDFEAAFDQLLALVSTDPKRAYISFYYRKQTKNHWARDDPAFLVVQACLVALCSLAYAVAFRQMNIWGYLWSVLYGLVVDWLLTGFLLASLLSSAANRYLRQTHSHTVSQSVEWMYALDVHANAFFVSFLVTYVLQYLLLPVVLGKGALCCILANSIYAGAAIWYSYITYLGYTTLPFLGNTQVFLWYPACAVMLLWTISVVCTLCGMHVNASRIVMAFHYG